MHGFYSCRSPCYISRDWVCGSPDGKTLSLRKNFGPLRFSEIFKKKYENLKLTFEFQNDLKFKKAKLSMKQNHTNKIIDLQKMISKRIPYSGGSLAVALAGSSCSHDLHNSLGCGDTLGSQQKKKWVFSITRTHTHAHYHAPPCTHAQTSTSF